MDDPWPEVYDPWWDVREDDEPTDTLEWESTHDISNEREN